MAEGAPPAGTANPRVNSADPAALKADPMPPASHGHNSSQNPTNEVASQAASWASRISAASAASTRSRRLYSGMARTTRRNAPSMIRSTHTVSQLLTERGTMSVPTALYHAVSTSNAPTTAAAERPMSGTTTSSPGGQWFLRPYRPRHHGRRWAVQPSYRAITGGWPGPGAPRPPAAPVRPATRRYPG